MSISKGIVANKEIKIDRKDQNLLVSIIVAFRNEEYNLPSLINSVLNLKHQNFELILVNDHSEDASHSIVQKFASKDKRIKLIQMLDGEGKKKAISIAVHQSKSELIFCTDADCILPTDWISQLLPYFESDKIKIVAAAVKLSYHNFFEKLQALEFSSLIATSAGAAKRNYPLMINAANMAFRKGVYLELENELDTVISVSGDDIFLLHYCKKKYPHSIFYHLSENTLVQSKPQKLFRDFINQRKRWASKSKFYTDNSIKWLGLIVLSMNVLFLVDIILLIVEHELKIKWILPIGIKFLIDFILLKKYLHIIREENLLKYFLLLEFILPIYIIFVGISSQLSSFNWKGRKFKI